jgi:tetratricopeptide (TPR) repeat protein
MSMNAGDWFNQAMNHLDSGNLQAALECLDKVVLEEPQAYGAWLNKGIVHEKFGDIDQAIMCYQQAVGIKPNLLQATANLGRLYFNEKQYHKARYWLRKLIDSGNTEAQISIAYQICEQESKRQGMSFISYSWSNKEFVKTILVPLLNDSHIEYFIDEDRIPQGDDMGELPWQIEQGLALCDTVLLVWSKHASASSWVSLELCSAIGMLKNIVPIVIDDTFLPPAIQTSIKKGSITPYYCKSPIDRAMLVKMLREQKSWALEVDRQNSKGKTEVTHWGKTKFEWVKLNGGILQDFYIGKYQVTQEQWEAVMGYNPSRYKGDKSRPVESVSWIEAQEFINRLNARDSSRHRLLTDIEWEFACRAGSLGNWCFGDDEDLLFEYAWLIDNTGVGEAPGFMIGQGREEGRPSKTITIETSPYYTNSVLTKKPNKWGIYHMHGNVWEWCQDDSFTKGNEGKKICRGGSFRSGGRPMRCSSRGNFHPDGNDDDLGFRLCKELRGR